MSSRKTPERENKQTITRNKQSRRKMLKTMAAGSGAVVAGSSLPEQWAKPMVDSVLLPAHAESTAALSCTVSASLLAYHDFSSGSVADQGNEQGDAVYGPFAFPGDYSELIPGSGRISLVPQISVTPGVTDNFTLTTSIGNESAVGGDTDLIQTSVTPDPTNGALAFNTIQVLGPDFEVDMTLTPDNNEFCGAPQVIEILFTD